MLLVYRWRTKQNLDYTYMMMYARSRGTYYVQVLKQCVHPQTLVVLCNCVGNLDSFVRVMQ